MISSKVLVPLVIGLACLFAILVGSNLAVDSSSTLTFVGVAGFAVFVLLFARDYWWIAIFIGLGCGGFAYFGFKIYAHECVLALAFAGLLPSLALNSRSTLSQARPPLPWYFYATGIYFCLHIFFSIALNDPRGFIEVGTIARAYFYGIWPLGVIFFFRSYGRSDLFKLAVCILQVMYVVRAFMTLATTYFPVAQMLPGINFVLPGSELTSGFDDLRWPGYGIVLMAVAILLSRPAAPVQFLQVVLIAFAFVCLLLSGGRVMLVSGLLAVIAGVAAARMWKSLSFAMGCTAFLVVLLNLFPGVLSNFDYRSQRALSILILDRGSVEAQVRAEGSDIWHERLEKIGLERWTASPRTFALGTGIQPWNSSVARESVWLLKFEALLQGAADTGNYESALWTMLAATGLVGFLLCVATVAYFAIDNGKRLWRDRLSGFDLSAAFLGTFVPLHWLFFSPRLGGYPQLELLFAAIAFYYLHDRAAGGVPSPGAPEDEGSAYSD